MVIVFISTLSHSLSTGPAWSVPARIAAQEIIDDVLWVNLSSADHKHWKEVKAYHNINDFDRASLDALPSPFNHPDIVVFESFYGGFKEIQFALSCWREHVDYIIVPRGSLTWQAMHNKSRWKKEVAHFLFYDKFVRNARVIQYLTSQESVDSFYRFKTNHFILPNGFNTPLQTKSNFSVDKIKGIYIGRIDILHKGIDILLDSIESLKQELQRVNFSLVIYGPHMKDYNEVERLIQIKGLTHMVSLGGEVLGAEKSHVLMDADVYFLTSRFEGHPMGLVEALAYGLPCLITTGANMRTEVEEYDAGWCSDTSVEGVKHSILQMISDRNIFLEKSINAVSLAKNYRWDTLAKEFHEEIKQVKFG